MLFMTTICRTIMRFIPRRTVKTKKSKELLKIWYFIHFASILMTYYKYFQNITNSSIMIILNSITGTWKIPGYCTRLMRNGCNQSSVSPMEYTESCVLFHPLWLYRSWIDRFTHVRHGYFTGFFFLKSTVNSCLDSMSFEAQNFIV